MATNKTSSIVNWDELKKASAHLLSCPDKVKRSSIFSRLDRITSTVTEK